MQITGEAQEILKEILEENEEGFIRVGKLSIGAGCSLKIKLGVTIDEFFDDEDDIRLDVDGLPIVVEKNLQDSLEDAIVSIGEEGITVHLQGCSK